MEKRTELRRLEDLIDVEQYVIAKGVSKVYEKKVSLSKDGTIKMNYTFARATDVRSFAVAIANDAKSILFIPQCDNSITLNKAGSTKDVEVGKKISKKKLPFPLSYIMEWDENNNMWIGKIDENNHL